ncbi:RhoGEF domain-containing protein [Apiospora marii]|uniref:RhoGEF domain-containing protein n=1 Tax=Apiospora marii TaxID=335849 RepID=UPI0031304E3B
MEAGNRDEEDRFFGLNSADRPFEPQSPNRRHDPYSHHYPQHHLDDHTQYDYGYDQDYRHRLDQHHYPDLDSPGESSNIDIDAALASYAANNRQAALANANLTNDPLNSHGAAEPDDFYKNFHADQDNLMASTMPPSQRHHPGAASTSSSPRSPPTKRTTPGNTTSIPSPAARAGAGSRNGGRSSLRSVSAPIDEPHVNTKTGSKPSASFGGKQPSVKDLKKRFDQNATSHTSNNSTSSSTGRKTNIPRVPAREKSQSSTTSNYRGVVGPSHTNGASPSSTSRPGTSREATHGSSKSTSSARTTQRSKYVAEDHTSSSSQSFASRIAKPRSTNTSHHMTTKSMNNLSPTSPTSPIASPPVPTRNQSTSGSGRPLLFGELPPGENDAAAAGFGIEGVRPRRTSESNIRSLSQSRVESGSPTDWYRNAKGTNERTRSPNKLTKPHHTRAHSDLVGTKSSQSSSRTTQTSKSQKQPTPASNLPQPASASSKLATSMRKQNSSASSTSASPPFSRSNSPSTNKRPPTRTQGNLAKTATTGAAASTARAKTPTTQTRSKTPTTQTASKRAPAAPTSNGSARLNAYISAPPPKLSPPLRSSRPRQPVSAATTTSSRMRAAERGRSPSKVDPRATSRQANEPPRRRKLSIGPIDFASRREQIKLSYTKSIRETEAKAAARREAAAERERKKKEAEAKARAEAEAEAEARAAAEAEAEAREEAEAEAKAHAQAQAQAQAEAEAAAEAEHAAQVEAARAAEEAEVAAAIAAVKKQQDREREQQQEQVALALALREVVQRHQEELDEEPEDDGPSTVADTAAGQPALVITTSFEDAKRAQAVKQVGLTRDSPTLGIPGSFPMGSPQFQDETPQSAVSNTTEFDGEQQTEPPLRQTPLSPEPPAVDNLGISAPQIASRESLSYRSPFEDLPFDDDSASFHISLDPASPEKAAEPTPTRSDFSTEPDIPGSWGDDDEYVPQPFTAPSYETRVTIIGRDSEFQTRPKETTPAPVAPEKPNHTNQQAKAGPSDYASPVQQSPPIGEYDTTATPLSAGSGNQESGLTKLEEFYVGPNVADSAAQLRGSTSGASVRSHNRTWSMEEPVAEPRSSLETRRTLETRPSLTVPRNTASANRASQNTVWTDYSIESRGDYPSPSYQFPNRDSVSETESQSHGAHYRGPIYDDQPQLPELDTGDGFLVDYITRKESVASPVPVLPDHSPPPPPEDVTFPDIMSSAPQSDYFNNDTRPSSYVQVARDDQSSFSMSRPQSENFDQPASTPRSVDQGSFETTEGRLRLDSQTTLAESIEQSEGTAGLSPKEKKRLFTRLETIKELVDTEAFFIRDMNIVEEIYKGTAEACPRLDDQTIKLIFRNTDQIIAFHSTFLAELKEGVSSVYVPKSHRAKDISLLSDGSTPTGAGSTKASSHLSDAKDRETSLGPIFSRNMEKMKLAHESFLKNSDHAAKRLIQIQEDPTVKVWLNECNEVARDLTKAWNLDSLLIKPMQRITKYPNLLIQLLHETPPDHPDRPALEAAKASLEDAIEEINKTKKNFELVGQIVGRKRKESDVRAGFAKAFGKRVDKLQATNRPPEDPDYLKLHEKFGDDYLRLQVVLRDVEFYTRQTATYVHEFLQYLSSMELVMRLQPSPHPEIESKWVRFNVSMRDIEKVALEQHLSQVRKQVIEPFELVIKAYGNPSLAMKKRAKRRLDYEKSETLKKAGKKLDKQLSESVEQYEALNEALKKELPKLSALTEKVGNICLGNFVNIQTHWYSIWKEKVKVVLDGQQTPELSEVVTTFQRDFKFQEDQMGQLAIANPTSRGRTSNVDSTDGSAPKLRSRPSELSSASTRGRGLSINSDIAPSIPTPDFARRNSGQLTMSPTQTSVPSPHSFYYKDYYAGINGHSRGNSGSPHTADVVTSHPRPPAPGSTRPGTGQSYESSVAPRQSSESNFHSRPYAHTSQAPSGSETQRYSGLFHSALPLPDGPERAVRASRASSRASSRERAPINGYNVLWLAASLFEFNIETTKHEAGYPYLTYQAGEIFDVIAEKGELWLAKNQDDPNNLVGWLWSKHFAKLADD